MCGWAAARPESSRRAPSLLARRDAKDNNKTEKKKNTEFYLDANRHRIAPENCINVSLLEQITSQDAQ